MFRKEARSLLGRSSLLRRRFVFPSHLQHSETPFATMSCASTFKTDTVRFQSSFSSADASAADAGADAAAVTRKELDDGRVFEGTFDSATGAPLPGTKLTDSGDVYVGEYNGAWQKHGRGKATLADGTVYEGRFEEDELAEGRVKMVDEAGDAVEFRGTLREGQFHHGTLAHSDYQYTGPFENNEPHGKGGVLRYATGAVQEGSFYRGRLHGEGCKWKLDSGQIYIGNFMHGVITSGELRTPTFTYEGEFNERGQAHGVGRQEHHATSPKLIFRGHWAQGSMVTGQCNTEDGQPVDWTNDTAAQEQLNSKETIMRQQYMRQKVAESRKDHGESIKRYAEDAETHYQQTGKHGDKIDLGYEAGPLTSRKIEEKQQLKAAAQMNSSKARFAEAAREVQEREEELKAAMEERQKKQQQTKSSPVAAAAAEEPKSSSKQQKQSQGQEGGKANSDVVPDISNWELARAALMKQKGKQMTTADTIHDQFERFKLQREKKKKQTGANAADPEAAEGKSQRKDSEDEFVVDPAPVDTLSAKPDRLQVDGNEPFVGMAAKTLRNQL